MERLPNFRSNLASVIADYECQPFKFGHRDCCLFGADVIKAQIGVDPAETYRGKYRTLKGGLKLFKADGFSDQADYLNKTFSTIEPAFSRFGDLALIETDGQFGIGYSVGVVGGSFIIALGERGLVRLPLFSAKTIYRVGN